jgi:protein-disulfide isomerase
VKKLSSLVTLLVLGALTPGTRAQQANGSGSNPSSAASSATQKSIEAYLRNLYAFGPDIQVTIGAPKESGIEGLLEVNINVLMGETKEAAKFYVSKDGRYLIRGDVSDMSKDPLVENRARIEMKNAPTLGDAKAPVTLVEYSDFECPVCRSLHDVLRGMLESYAGKIRVVFKDFPIEQIHPWARTAAIAGRCAYQQDPKAFWKMYDLIYDNQEIISAANAWTKMTDYASQIGLNAETFKSCMASPEAGDAINASRANGQQLEVSSTPTIFVNGRSIVGADPHLLEQYINYELAQQKTGKPADKK